MAKNLISKRKLKQLNKARHERVDYPEHDKMEKVQDDSQVIGEFLEWLQTEQIMLCKWKDKEVFQVERMLPDTPLGRLCEPKFVSNPEGFYPSSNRTEQVLAQYFGIDLDIIEKEKRQIVKNLANSVEIVDLR